MRIIQASGGLEFGRHGQPPWVDAIPVQPGALSLRQVEDALIEHVAAWQAGRVPSIAVQHATGLAGMYVEGNFWLRLICARGQSYAEALRAVDREEGGLSPAIAVSSKFPQ